MVTIHPVCVLDVLYSVEIKGSRGDMIKRSVPIRNTVIHPTINGVLTIPDIANLQIFLVYHVKRRKYIRLHHVL